MRKQMLYLLLLLAVLLMPLAACGGDNEPEKPSLEPTSIPEQAPDDAPSTDDERVTILFAVNDVEQPLYEGLIDTFEENNPGIHVKLVSINEILELDLLGGEPPEDTWQRLASNADVVNTLPGQEAVKLGLVRDLTPLIQADPNFDAGDFYPNALEASQWGGGAWGLPTRMMFDVIYYDKDALDEAGAPYPAIGWSWDDFLATAQALTVREGDAVSRWGFVQPWTNITAFTEGRAGKVIDYETDPPTVRLDQPEVAEAVRWYVDLYVQEKVVPLEEEGGDLVTNGQALVESGDAPMWHDWSVLWSYRKEQGNRGLAPYPVDAPDSRTSLIQTMGAFMSAGTAQPDAAWRWMVYLTHQDLSRQGPLVRFMPPRISVADSIGYWDDADPELAAVLRYALEHSYISPQGPVYETMYEALLPALRGEVLVDEALEEAQAQAEAAILDEQAAQAEATPAPAVVVAAPEDETPVAEGTTVVNFNTGLGFLYAQGFRDAAQQFHALHPEILVEVQMPDLTDTSLSMQKIAGASDCFQWTADVRNPQNQDAILSLEPFMDADPEFDANDFYPLLLDRFTWQGQLWGLPSDLQPFVVEYNKALFDAAGLDYPASGDALLWSTDDLLETASALAQGEGETRQYGYVPQGFEVNDLLLLMELRGARLIDLEADPPAFTLDDPSAVAALRWYADLSTVQQAKPIFIADIARIAELGGVAIEREGLISAGRAAMWTNMGGAVTGNRAELDVGVAPLPAGSSGAAGSGTAGGYFISAHSAARQACWQWIVFLTSQPGLTEGLPSRRSVAESQEYEQQVGQEWADVYRASVAGAESASLFDVLTGEAWLSGGIYWMGRAYEQVVNEQVSVEEALDAAQQMADDYRACVVANDAVDDEQGWQGCMQEVDPSLPSYLFSQ